MKVALLVFFVSLTIFFSSGWNNHTRHHFFIPLAQAFLNGRLYVDKMEPELHEMVSEKEVQTGVYDEPIDSSLGKYFVIYPPLPAVLLTPFVAIWGSETNQSYFSLFLASISIAVSFLVFKQLTNNLSKSLAMVALYAFGSMLWYHAVVGSAWYYSQVCGLLFLWLAVLAILKKQKMALIGILLGFAYLSRYSLILSFPFFLYMTKDKWLFDRRLILKPLIILCLSLVLFIGISVAYNWVRYERLDHYGYSLLEKRPYNISNEYSEGSYSLSYASHTLRAMFWSFPTKIDYIPYFVPNHWSMGLWIVFPAIFLIFFAPLKERIVKASWLAIACIIPVSLFHGGIGASQFGYRYALDYMPFLLILITMAIIKKFNWWQKTLFLLSILVNVWGIWNS